MKHIVTYSKSFIDFLRNDQSEISRFLWNVYASCHDNGEEYCRMTYGELLTNREIDYLNYRSNGMVSYLPAGKELKKNADGQWARDGRQDGKPGKVMRKILTEKGQLLFKPQDFEMFANKFKAKFATEGYAFSLLDRSEIPNVYGRRRPAEESSSLAKSCMQAKGFEDVFDIYVNCPQVQILILEDAHKSLLGRCLVWTMPDGKIIADRFYVSADHLYDYFCEYCSNQGWWHKREYRTFDFKEHFVGPDGQEQRLQLEILTKTEFKRFPYIDTFSYGEDGMITNQQYRASGDNHKYGYWNFDMSRVNHYPNEGKIRCRLTDRWCLPSEIVVLTGGSYAGNNCYRPHTIEFEGLVYYSDDQRYIVRTSPQAKDERYRDMWLKTADAIRVDYRWYHKSDRKSIAQVFTVSPIGIVTPQWVRRGIAFRRERAAGRIKYNRVAKRWEFAAKSRIQFV